MANSFHISFERKLAPIPTKSHKGQSYRDIIAELGEKMPPEWHDIKKLGYNKQLKCDMYYAFIPWWRYRDRIQNIVGNDGFQFEKTETYVSTDGDPIIVGILNILGVEKQGVGYGRTKDGYKGGKEEIAWADAFKNAAEAHGIGTYLDDQLEVVTYLLSSQSPIVKPKARLLAVQFQKENKLTRASIPGGEPSTPPPTKQPPKSVSPLSTNPTPALYEQHNLQVKNLRSRVGLPPEAILLKTGNKEPGKLSLEQFGDLVRGISCDWATANRLFESEYHAKTHLDQYLKEHPDVPFFEGVNQWLDLLRCRP